MNVPEVNKDVRLQLERMEIVVAELEALQRDVRGRQPTLREKTAAGSFLAQFYGGVENVLRRISIYEGAGVPEGDRWHAELFGRFCNPADSGLPALFDAELASDMTSYRGFRHVVRSGYSLDLDWERMNEGIHRIGGVFSRFASNVQRHLASIG
jgi:hypothetical protein